MRLLMSEQEAGRLLQNGDILELGAAAGRMRDELHPGNRVTFVIDRNINYTNVCSSECRFCAFFRRQGHKDAYVLSTAEIIGKVQEAVNAGGTQIMLQGGLHPDLGLDYYLQLLETIKKNFSVTIHSFSPAEILHLSKNAGLPVAEILHRLKISGLDSLPGGGAEILSDEIRQQVSPRKISSQDWLSVMRAAHKQGIQSTATMVIGMGELYRHRVEHFDKIRQLQAETGGFRAFIMWSYQPGNTELGGQKTSAWDYLRTLAVARLYLHNILHLQGSWVTQGERIGQLTLAFGANDLGSIMLEENVVRAAGTAYDMSVSKLVGLIRSAGKIPAQRDTEYNIIKTF